MTREVLSLHIGQCGCHTGLDAWKGIASEHIEKWREVVPIVQSWAESDNAASEMPHSFFYESDPGSWRPRAVFVDTDPSVRSVVTEAFSESGISVDEDSIVDYKQDCRSNFFEGLLRGRDSGIAQNVLDQLLNQADRCDSLSGFLIYRSLGGGTGSGVATTIMEKIHDEFPKKIVFEPLIYPSTDSSTSTVEPYNCIFGLSSTRDLASLSLMLDNQAATKICRTRLGISNPKFSDLNTVLSRAISDCTSTLRFPSSLNASLVEIVTNLVPDPTFRYPIVSLSYSQTSSVREVVTSLFDQRGFLCDSGPNLKLNRYFAASVIGRTVGPGASHLGELQRAVHALKETDRRNPAKFFPWIPNSFKVGLVGNSLKEGTRGCLLANSTAVRSLFVRQYEKFLCLFFHRAYVWQFLEAGGEMDSFLAAKENVRGLIDSYGEALKQCRDEEVLRLRAAATSAVAPVNVAVARSSPTRPSRPTTATFNAPNAVS